MSKKTSLIFFYSCVALICIAIMCVVNLVIIPGMRSEREGEKAFVNVGGKAEEKWLKIEKDCLPC